MTRELAEELREYTAMKYAGDCKCGKCQLVPRTLIDRLILALRAQPSDGGVAGEPVAWRIKAALFEPEESDAYDNLDGALIDIERLSEQGKPTDAVCIRTIRRVLTQLNAVHNILAVLHPVPGNEGREKEITRLATIEECAQLIESGAGMADLIDQEELDQQAKYIRGLSHSRSEGKTP